MVDENKSLSHLSNLTNQNHINHKDYYISILDRGEEDRKMTLRDLNSSHDLIQNQIPGKNPEPKNLLKIIRKDDIQLVDSLT